MNFDKPTIARTGIHALIVAMIFVTAITIISDLFPPVKNWLAATHGHHWVGKGIWTVILFSLFTVVAYPLLKRNQCALSPTLVRNAGHLAIVAGVLITLFFLYEYLSH